MKRRHWLALLSTLLPTACAPTLSVYGVMAGEVYTGSTTGDSQYGSMTLSNGKGKTCVGERVGAASGSNGSGHGVLSCNDGSRIQMQYTKIGFASGYGFGNSSNGDTVRFTFGLSPDQSTPYLGNNAPQAVAGAAAPSAPGPITTKGTGSGFFITRQGHLLTNAHVVNDCKEVAVARVGGGSSAATIVAKDRQNDLALLRVDTPVSSVAALRSGRPLRQGETVVAYGFPLTGLVSSGGTLTTGTVSALTGIEDDARFLQVSTQIQPGNSGGPLMDTTGAIVGVTTSSLNDTKLVRATGSVPQNVNFALKTDVVKTFLDSARVSAELSSGGRELSLPDIGEKARTFTALIECKR